METSRTDLVAPMRARIRRHMLVSVGGVVIGGLGMAMCGGLSQEFEASSPLRLLFVGAAGLCLVLMPAIGFWSTYKNLRCPGCDNLVAWQVSWNYSLFSARAGKTCRHCHATIFPPDLSRRFLIMIVVAFALGMFGAIANVMLSQ